MRNRQIQREKKTNKQTDTHKKLITQTSSNPQIPTPSHLHALQITRLWHVEDAEDENETRAWRTKLGRAAQDLTGMLLGQSPPQGLPRRSSTRVLVGAWLLFSMVVVYVYKGNLTASLMLPKYPPRPETLAELVTAVDT